MTQIRRKYAECSKQPRICWATSPDGLRGTSRSSRSDTERRFGPHDLAPWSILILAGGISPCRIHLFHLWNEIEIAGHGHSRAGGGGPQISRQKPDAVAQYSMVHERRCMVQHHDIHIICIQGVHEIRRQIGRIPPRTLLDVGFVDVHRHIHVATGMAFATSAGTEQIRFKDFGSRL